jgi:hypothetical protein
MNKHFGVIIITHISHNTSHKFNTPLSQLTTTREALNTTKLNTTEKYPVYEEAKN